MKQSDLTSLHVGGDGGKLLLGFTALSVLRLAGKPVGWFAPSYKYLKEAWRDFSKVLSPIITAKNETEYRIELITSGTLEFWTLEDVDSGRGRKYQRIGIDEAAKTKNLEAWWTNAGRATLADLEGDADFYSTPRGRNYFWRVFTQGEDPTNRDWSAFRAPSMDNPHVPSGEWEEIKRQLPERSYRQEILAEFIDEAGGVFRCVAESIDRGRRSNDEPEVGRTYCTGIDLARVEDFTVITVFDRAGRRCTLSDSTRSVGSEQSEQSPEYSRGILGKHTLTQRVLAILSMSDFAKQDLTSTLTSSATPQKSDSLTGLPCNLSKESCD